MARKKSPTLTEAELKLMEVLWAKGSATVSQVVEEVRDQQAPAYTTVMTCLRILEDKGYVRHTKQGRAFVYHPVIKKVEARQNAIRFLVSRFFDNSPELLVLNVLEHEKLNHEQLKQLEKMLEESR
jgi:predicted transcriptional regulator